MYINLFVKRFVKIFVNKFVLIFSLQFVIIFGILIFPVSIFVMTFVIAISSSEPHKN
jgi:hypothetical protein